MPTFSKLDSVFMARALRLARNGQFTARPNPSVGCVIVSQEQRIGEGWHDVAGGPHAEVVALAEAGGRASGATAYVTLEPCAHHGRTPPCSSALIDAGIARVVAAMQDPFDKVAGQGIAALEAASIEVHVGLMEDQARALNAGYLCRIEQGRPRVRLKVAASLDGATAMQSGESQWITGPEARRDVQRLRAGSGAVMTGVETVIADNPSLNVRESGFGGAQPLSVILDSQLRTPVEAKLLGVSGETVVYCCADANNPALEQSAAEVVRLPGSGPRVDIAGALRDLARRNINDVLVECGPTLAGSLIDGKLLDELVIYQSPHIMGSQVRPMFTTPGWDALQDRRTLDIVDVRRLGRDTRITARISA